MKKKSPTLPLLALICFYAISLPCTAAPDAPVTNAQAAGGETTGEAKLTLTRNGAAVLVAWVLPPGDYRTIEVTRNNEANPRGRSSVGSARSSDLHILDTVPDKTGTYWYWLKVTRTDLTVFNVGPVMSDATTASATSTSAETASDLPSEPILTAARNGADVLIMWKLPAGDYRAIEVTRHTQSNPRGRSGVASLGPADRTYVDTLPDKTATYWYWLKVTRTDLTVFNIGPVMSAPAEVWTP